jgi:phage gpG-like protein
MIKMELIGGKETVARFETVSRKVYEDLRNTIQEQWFGLQAYIVTNKLSGQVLKRRTGLLASSINVGGPESTSEFTADESVIIGKVGTAVIYAAPHEYGAVIHRTSSLGKPFVQTFPERSFLRSGLQDRQTQIRSAINATVTANMRKLTVNG